jgi:hypothetical protein
MRPTRVLAGLSVLLLPILFGIAEVFRSRAEPSTDGGSAADRATALASIEANLGDYVTAGWMFLAATLLVVPAFLTLHRLAALASPRWAAAGLTLGFAWALGFMAHLGGNFGTYPLLATHQNRAVAADIYAAESAYWVALDLPWLLGLLLGPLVIAVALRRSRIIPRWALGAVAVATVLQLAVGTGVGVLGWSALMVLGFVPAALAAARTSAGSVTAPPVGTPALA